jgi:hypothetical protein
MKSKPWSLFCPFCNARGIPQPVLSPMTCCEVRVAPVESDDPGRVPYFSYRCERCGFVEIHDRIADAA